MKFIIFRHSRSSWAGALLAGGKRVYPYRTPSVNQYWAIVNASLPCNIICSLSRLKFASFMRIRTT